MSRVQSKVEINSSTVILDTGEVKSSKTLVAHAQSIGIVWISQFFTYSSCIEYILTSGRSNIREKFRRPLVVPTCCSNAIAPIQSEVYTAFVSLRAVFVGISR